MSVSAQPSTGESATTVDIAEAKSFHKSMTLASHLAEDLETALQAYSSSSDVYSSSWADLLFATSEDAELQVQMVLEDIERIVQTKEEEHRRLFAEEYDELLASRYATTLLRQRLRRVLEQIQTKMLAALRLEAKAHVDDTMQLLVRQLLAGVKEGAVTDGKDLRRLLAEARRADLLRLRALTRLLHQRTSASPLLPPLPLALTSVLMCVYRSRGASQQKHRRAQWARRPDAVVRPAALVPCSVRREP